MPNLVSPKNIKNFKLGKYGLLRLGYLKEHKKVLYTELLMNNKLQKHLMYIDKTANKRVEELVKAMAINESVDEKLKSEKQMLWVGKMNNIKTRAEEIVFNELIYI